MALLDNARMAWIRVIDKTKIPLAHSGSMFLKLPFYFRNWRDRCDEGTEFGLLCEIAALALGPRRVCSQ